ncbi:MAG: FdhF/YdeP family oxidoreductase [Candidatus Eisenbacteria bacterium]
MAKPTIDAGGGMAALAYVLKKAQEAGGFWKLYERLSSRNACKTCALGMGGQKGGMRNEAGHWPEVCKKSIQAQAGDMAGTVSEEFLAKTPVRQMEGLTSAQCEQLGRVAFPMIAEADDGHYRRISWDRALNRIVDGFLEVKPEEVFFYASGRSSNEAAFLFQLVARAFGTENVHNCSYYCHAASSVALGEIYGSGTASITLDDLAKADLALVAGANPASNHPRLITQLVGLRQRGGKVIVINPLRELGLLRFRIPSDPSSMLFGSAVSDVYLQPHVGADIPLLLALLQKVIDFGGLDREFVTEHTSDWKEVEQALGQHRFDDLVQLSGVEREEIDLAARLLAAASRGICLWAMGLTHHEHGVDNVRALCNVALARGWLGRPGCGLLPIRGHSNVQGVGSVGVSPHASRAFAERLSALYGVSVGEGRGLDTYSSMVAAHEGRIRVAVLLGGNLWASTPDSRWAAEALRRIPLVVSLTTKLNQGHTIGRGHATLVLPVLARDEEPESTTQESMFNFVRLSEGGKPAVAGEMRSEVDIIASIAERILPEGRFSWEALRSHESLRAAIAKTVPGYGPLAEISTTKREFQIEGRTFHAPRFRTPDGRARFSVTPLPRFAAGADEFRLMTLRSEGQFNTVVYDEEDLYRGNTRRDVVMIAEADARRLGLTEGTRVRVVSAAGKMEASVAIVDIRAGSLAMYYPEANVLVPRRLDRESGTPAFKSIAVKLELLPPR